MDFTSPDSIVLSIDDEGNRFLTRPGNGSMSMEEESTPVITNQDLPPHLRNLGEPMFGQASMSDACPTVAPYKEQLLSQEYRGWMRLLKFPVESQNPDTSATQSRMCEIHEDPTHAAPITVMITKRFAVVSKYSLPNEDGWIKVGYKGKVGWARNDLFVNVRRCRKHELHQGRNNFFCHGKVMLGPDLVTFRMSNLLILVPTIIWFATVFPNFEGGKNKVTWLILNTSTCCGCLLFLWLTATTDPGIIPRREPHEKLCVPVPVEQHLNKRRDNPGESDDLSLSDKTSPAGWKYCNSCKVYRPPRSKHCSYCDNCVDRFDHHCPWTSTCIGRRNYKYFTSFVWSCTWLCVFIFVSSFMLLKQHIDKEKDQELNSDRHVNPSAPFDHFKNALTAYPLAFGLMIYTFFAFWSVFGLSSFHSMLICVGETTNENIRGVYHGERGMSKNKEWDRGGLGNCCVHWLRGKGKGKLGDMSEILLTRGDTIGRNTEVEGVV